MSELSTMLNSIASVHKDCSPVLSKTCKAAASELDRLETLFGKRFHLDAVCGSCGGPLECERDGICCRCTEADTAAELDRLQAIVDRLPKTADGVLYANYTPATGVSGFALWRYTGEDQVRVSPCHRPDDPDESATGHAWIIDDCEDECEVIGVYSTREAAEQGRQT